MPLIIDKLLRALLTIYVLSYYNKALDDNTYSDFIGSTLGTCIAIILKTLFPYFFIKSRKVK